MSWFTYNCKLWNVNQDMPQNKKVKWQCKHNAKNLFFYLSKRKRYLCSEKLKQPFFFRMIARVFVQCKQSYLWFIANNDRNMLWGHNAVNYFLNLSWNIHTYHLHSITSTTSSWLENWDFNVTVYKWDNSNNHGHNVDNSFLNLLS